MTSQDFKFHCFGARKILTAAYVLALSSPLAATASCSTDQEYCDYRQSQFKDGPNIGLLINPRQGLSKAASAASLDTETKTFLDKLILIYGDADAKSIINKKNIFELFEFKRLGLRQGAVGTNRKRDYREELTGAGVLSKRGWETIYEYRSPKPDLPLTWGVTLEISINDKVECLESRAIEGYLDADISTTALQQSGPIRGIDRHSSPYSIVCQGKECHQRQTKLYHTKRLRS